MSISAGGWDSALYSDFTSRGFSGTKLADFTAAIGGGSASSVIGASFTTVDAGSITGPGVGVGTGILTLVATRLRDAIVSALTNRFGSAGDKLLDTAEAVADTLVSQMGSVTLSSTHTPVAVGVGTLVVGSIGVVASAWDTAMKSLGDGSGFVGDNWPDITEILADECVNEILGFGTGSVVISGTPVPGVPGAGVGAGTLS